MATRFALISVYDKTGIVEFARRLSQLDFGIIATGTTHKTLTEGGVNAVEVSEYTGSPEMFGGRVKTLHPKIHAGILHKQSVEHLEELSSYEIPSIDLVVCNLYPFRDARKKPDAEEDDIIEMIDIGGPTLIRAAAKTHHRVGVVCDPSDYDDILKELTITGGILSDSTRHYLAAKAFKLIALYDYCIYDYFNKSEDRNIFIDDEFLLGFEKVADLKYGENPHQLANLYRRIDERQVFPDYVDILSGSEIGFCNYLDCEGVLSIMCEFNEDKPFAVVVKHANPIGAAFGETPMDAFKRARGVDEMSAFGGIIGITGKVDMNLAKTIKEIMFSIIMASDYDVDALELLSKRKSRIIIKLKPNWRDAEQTEREIKILRTSVLVQDWDALFTPLSEWKIVTKRVPTPKEEDDLWLAWRVCKHVKSNAILLAKDGQTIGTGAGQQSRIDSFKIAIEKAGENAKGAIAASDAFFPFEDNVELAHSAGISAIIQPGGSIRDKQIIEKCDELGIAMVFTGRRHFRH
jgi:phosphoribosylaminoimidazolecarboxamide formyltransferase/IMP cyclohydrolase